MGDGDGGVLFPLWGGWVKKNNRGGFQDSGYILDRLAGGVLGAGLELGREGCPIAHCTPWSDKTCTYGLHIRSTNNLTTVIPISPRFPGQVLQFDSVFQLARESTDTTVDIVRG